MKSGSRKTTPRQLVRRETYTHIYNSAASTPSFADAIQDEYKISVPFFHGSYEEARHKAQDLNQYLVVYLHCPTHENTPGFVKSVLGADEVIAAWCETAVLFGTSVMDAPGNRLAHELHATTFPFIAVFYKTHLVMRLQGGYKKSDFLAEWVTCTELWDGVLAEEASLRYERDARERERRAQEQRDRAMEREDMARLERLKQEQQAQQQAQSMSREAEAAAQRRTEEEIRQEALCEELAAARARRQREAKERLPDEPAADVSGDHIVQINLKCPSGRHYHRRFWRNDLVESLYDYAMTLSDYDGGEVLLLAGVPPKPLECARATTRFADVHSLCPRAAVLMRTAGGSK